MDLYLVRHARAFEPDVMTWPDDGERPLTPDGEKRFRKAARGLRKMMDPVDLLLSSPLARALRTAQLLSKQARWPDAVQSDVLAGEHTPQDVLEALQEYAETPSIALVGHEPNLHELASYLLTGDTDRSLVTVRRGAVLALRLDDGLLPGSASLQWSVPQRLLRAL